MRALVPVVVAVALTWSGLSARTPEPLPYKNPALPVADRVKDLVGRMTLEEKFWQLYMIPGDLSDPSHDYSHGVFGLQIAAPDPDAPEVARRHTETINAIQRYFVERTRLGIPILVFEEALHGLKAPGATMFPQAIGLAATWDTALMRRVAEAAASEAATRGIRDVLSPVVNIADDVRWGRVEETYGEDPYLASAMARAFVGGIEFSRVIATPKHFVANVGEGGRDSYPVYHNERMLMERYFPPFQAALAAGARSIMTAYNSVDGAPATQNPRLLNEILKGDWQFGGFVISDAAATGGATVLHMTEPNTATAAAHALRSGLDVIFQSAWAQHRPYWNAFQRGLIPAAVIDTAVGRVLRAKFTLGLFEHPYADVDAAGRVNGARDHVTLARAAARASLVLLKNDHRRLPLAKTLGSIAVIGTDATEARLGGYSGPGNNVVSILDGIRLAVSRTSTVRYAPGPGRLVDDVTVIPATAFSTIDDGHTVPGLAAQYFDNPRLDGRPALSRVDPGADFRWTLTAPGRGIPFDWYSARWAATLTAPAEGAGRLAVEGNDGYRLWLDGTVVIDRWFKRSYGRQTIVVDLAPGTRHDIRLEFFETTGNARLKLLWDAGAPNATGIARRTIDDAVAAARGSDVAVIVAGLDEGEFRDRAFITLPGLQEELITAVAATGAPVVVVLVGGSAVGMSRWLDRVDAVVDAWYPGEQGGHAVADALFGDTNPAGRLPVTFAMSEGQLPLSYDHRPTGRGDDYLDLTGMPLFPFGHGLSYTTFVYSDLSISPDQASADDPITVSCRVTNTGSRIGDEVVQLYVKDVLASLARPVMSLKGFARVQLAPAESTTVRFALTRESLRMLDARMQWVVEPGEFRVLIGASSEDIRVRGTLTIR